MTYIFSSLSIFSLLLTVYIKNFTENFFISFLISTFLLCTLIYANTSQIDYFSHKSTLLGLMFLYMCLYIMSSIMIYFMVGEYLKLVLVLTLNINGVMFMLSYGVFVLTVKTDIVQMDYLEQYIDIDDTDKNML
jgi:hypothetical protein